MSTAQIAFALTLVIVLLGTAAYVAWRQIQILREVAGNDNLPTDERDHLRSRARRRLATCVLLLLLAGWLGGFLFLEPQAQQFLELVRENPELKEEQKPFWRFYGWYVIGGLLALLVLVGIAGVDLMAVRRHGQRQYQKLREDRRAMIERQAARLRQERNGHN